MSKIAIVFPGQGSQFPKMGNDFKENFKEYKDTFEQIYTVNQKLEEIYNDEDNPDINLTINAQCLLFANQMGILNTIKSLYDIKDEVYAGFSLGEYSALCAAKVFDYNQGIKIVDKRARLMSEIKSDYTTKVAIGKTKEELEQLIKCIKEEKKLDVIISNYNLEKQLLINYPKKNEEECKEYFKENGLKKIIDLNVSGPFHTKFYESAAKQFEEYLKGIELNDNVDNLYLNYTAKRYSKEDLRDIMKEQMVNGVLWYDEVKNMIEDGVDIFVEIGSKSILASMIKKINKEVKVITIETVQDIDKLEEVWKRK